MEKAILLSNISETNASDPMLQFMCMCEKGKEGGREREISHKLAGTIIKSSGTHTSSAVKNMTVN